MNARRSHGSVGHGSPAHGPAGHSLTVLGSVVLGLVLTLGLGLVEALAQDDRSLLEEVVVLSPAAVDSIDAQRVVRIQHMYEGYRRDFPEIGELSAAALQEALEVQELVLVDVRRQEEREVSVLHGSMSREEYEARRAEFVDMPVVTYCTIGYRSGRYADILRKNGIEAYNLVGGILAWVHAGGAVEVAGQPTLRVHVYGQQWSLLPVGYEPVW